MFKNTNMYFKKLLFCFVLSYHPYGKYEETRKRMSDQEKTCLLVSLLRHNHPINFEISIAKYIKAAAKNTQTQTDRQKREKSSTIFTSIILSPSSIVMLKLAYYFRPPSSKKKFSHLI